ncbi:ABC transporter [Salipiger aestuarii]|uniref:Peptide/nickel transport system ATP-binding protein n=1 Tax=Salipiger aestuarii TaxID=568098 RepID=A0A327YKE6_9RHOB|nr:ABC transporter ATP-binding protein [Salipiger aestuarii]EIE50384.1 oligopeptide/dipeptide ABC transporter, ATPase subunit [Citreicella sp. 357]KAA8609341.1 ABC transporter [Salipiger aestuarii]KAA8615122.1 ABC transporter [Salipiger aestuarii]KAB2542953.1 ABC transporter [Salipiger aestuarii]RAK20882.1 peptide/nickel transport system ATP-binding protein [Salipiger aestuarii]
MVLSVNDVTVTIDRPRRTAVHPVRGVSLSLKAGETLALVGESGCGKSMTCLALAGLLPNRAAIASGTLVLDGTDLGTLSPRDARDLRRRKMASVFQDATGGLNPVRSIGWQVAQAVRMRGGATRHAAQQEAVRLLGRVGLPDPERRAREFPHQFSGGMNQRAMIALAIAGNPKLLIADEATTALDVTLQAQILELIADLRRALGMGVLFVTHDLGLVAQHADSVAVMYAGRIVERASTDSLFANPRHPYTQGLLAALPDAMGASARLASIDGTVPPIDALPAGCAFAPRCVRASAICTSTVPDTVRGLACHHPGPRVRPAVPAMQKEYS